MKNNNWYKIFDYLWVIIAIIIFFVSIKYLNDGTLGERVAALGLWGPLIIFILKISTLVFAPLGGTPLYVISGALYGNWYGFLLCFAGDFVGTVICFAIGRKFGTRAIKFFAGSNNMEKIEKAVSLLDNTKSFLKARIAFITIPELVAYAASLSKIKFPKFILLQMPLYIPTGFILVFLGSTVTVLSARYAIYLSLIAIALASIGVWTLSKDYRKIEGM